MPPRAAPPAWALALGGMVSVGLLAAIVVQLRHTSSAILALLTHLPPAAFVSFALLYMVQPLADLIIYRRVWNFPFAGLAALFRKTAINEVLFDYSGELYLYLWARRRAGLAEAPIDAIKDVNILSALIGAGLTLVLLILAATQVGSLDLVPILRPLLWPGVAVMVISLTILVFARRVFSLRRDDLIFVAMVHALRLAATSTLTITTWRLALPGTDPGVWVVLLAVSLLVARIPFVTNKNLLVGNVVLLTVGTASSFGLLLAGLAVVTLAAHLVVIALLGANDVARLLLTSKLGTSAGR